LKNQKKTIHYLVIASIVITIPNQCAVNVVDAKPPPTPYWRCGMKQRVSEEQLDRWIRYATSAPEPLPIGFKHCMLDLKDAREELETLKEAAVAYLDATDAVAGVCKERLALWVLIDPENTIDAARGEEK